jgi:hypothetical protein
MRLCLVRVSGVRVVSRSGLKPPSPINNKTICSSLRIYGSAGHGFPLTPTSGPPPLGAPGEFRRRMISSGHTPATLSIIAQPCPTDLAITIGSPSLLRRSTAYSPLSVHRRTTKSRRRSNIGSNMSPPNSSRQLMTLWNDSHP